MKNKNDYNRKIRRPSKKKLEKLNYKSKIKSKDSYNKKRRKLS